MREGVIDLGMVIEAMTQNVGAWFPATNGLQVGCRPEDNAGVILVRGQNEAFGLSVTMPSEEWLLVPGMTPPMEVCTGSRAQPTPYGVLMVRGPEDAWWWTP